MTGIQEALLSRRTVYRFKEDEVENSILDVAFKAAMHAPNHKKTNPWRYYVLGVSARTLLLPEVERLSRSKMLGQSVNDIESGLKRAVSKIMSPPVLIAVSSALTPSDSFREMEDYAATSCSIQNFCLSLWGNGIGTQWSTGAITRADSTYEALGIPKDREQIVGFLKAGYPETLPEKEKLDVEDFRTYLP